MLTEIIGYKASDLNSKCDRIQTSQLQYSERFKVPRAAVRSFYMQRECQ